MKNPPMGILVPGVGTQSQPNMDPVQPKVADA